MSAALQIRTRDAEINKTKLKLDEYLFAYLKKIRSQPNFENEIATISLDSASCKIFWNKLLEYPYIKNPQMPDKFAFMILLLMDQEEVEKYDRYLSINLRDYFHYSNYAQITDSNCICSKKIGYRFKIEHKSNGREAWLGCDCIVKSKVVNREQIAEVKKHRKQMTEFKKKGATIQKCEKCEKNAIHNPNKGQCMDCQEKVKSAFSRKDSNLINEYFQHEKFKLNYSSIYDLKKITDFQEKDTFKIKEAYCIFNKYGGLNYKLKIVINDKINYIWSNYAINQILNRNIVELKINKITSYTFIINKIHRNNKGYLVASVSECDDK